MAEVYTKELLSGGTNGKHINVAATATTGTTVHTTVSGTSSKDEIWLYATNTSSNAVLLTIEFGGTTDPDNLMQITIPAQSGPMLVIPGWLLQNSLVITAFAGTANVINLNGYVTRITVS